MSSITPIFILDTICFDVLPTYIDCSGNNLTKVVQTVYFKLIASFNDYTTTFPSTCFISYLSAYTFLTLTDLTKDVVENWINKYCYALPSLQQILRNIELSQFQQAVFTVLS